jgi:hypothetical protein
MRVTYLFRVPVYYLLEHWHSLSNFKCEALLHCTKGNIQVHLQVGSGRAGYGLHHWQAGRGAMILYPPTRRYGRAEIRGRHVTLPGLTVLNDCPPAFRVRPGPGSVSRAVTACSFPSPPGRVPRRGWQDIS